MNQVEKNTKPLLSSKSIWNLSMGFFGIQSAFALQNGNASRILQIFGADVDKLPLFWLAAPLTGMIIQPIIGYYSDHTWTKIGRRKPFFLAGAILTALALLFLPGAKFLSGIGSPLLIGAILLMLMDMCINVAMEPFRALVADLLPEKQLSKGFAIQTCLIGIGAVLGSWLPYLLAEGFHISKVAPQGIVPDNVKYSFLIGAVILLVTIFWTVVTTKEYKNEGNQKAQDFRLSHIFREFRNIPLVMKKLGWVQFFTWFGLFSMWVFFTPAIAEHIYHTKDTASEAYNDAGNWVGILFGIYNGVSAIYALFIAKISKRFGNRATHLASLFIGGISLVGVYFIHSPMGLILPMIGVGIAWGSILSMPYAILSSELPADKMGLFMGMFNFFITLPQIVNGIFGGLLVKYIYKDQSINAVIMAGVFLMIAGLMMLRIKNKPLNA